MIKLNQISFGYNQDEKFLDKIDFEIPENKFITIIGQSGSGKTTLAKLIAGILSPGNGKITVDGYDFTGQKPAYIGKNSDYNSIFTTTLEELTAFGPENSGIPGEEISARIIQSLKITGLEKFRFFPVHALSRGQKQIAALASFLTLKPKYLVLDEPTSLLDEIDEKKFWEIVKTIHKSYKIGIIYFSNGIFVPGCDSLFYIKNKKIEEIKTDSAILSEKIPVNTSQIADDSSIVLEIKNAGYSPDKNIFNKGNLILKNVNLKISKGEFVFIYGNSGSGKSTLAKLIANLIKPSFGEVNFPSFSSKKNTKSFRQKIGLIFQEPENQFLTENIGQEINFGLANFNVPEKESIERTEWIFGLLSLNYDYLKNQDMLYFPLAGKRKIAAASALVLFPEILVIDDILTGLDIEEKNALLKAFIEYQKRTNCACLFFTGRKSDIISREHFYVLNEGNLIYK
ncbi:MAG: ATP-binding cassette domain-containing protein [bacterium]